MNFITDRERFFALTVSDVLGSELICRRISSIVELSRTYGSLGALCVRNDSHSPDRFEEAVLLATTLWPGRLILQSDDMSAISKSMLHAIDRQPLILCTDYDSLPVADMAASAFKSPLAVECSDARNMAEQMSMVSCESVVSFLPAVNMKECLENTEIFCRMKDVCIELRDIPYAVRVWSGEYAVAVATVAFVNGASIAVFDDLDEIGCETMDLLLKSLCHGWD